MAWLRKSPVEKAALHTQITAPGPSWNRGVRAQRRLESKDCWGVLLPPQHTEAGWADPQVQCWMQGMGWGLWLQGQSKFTALGAWGLQKSTMCGSVNPHPPLCSAGAKPLRCTSHTHVCENICCVLMEILSSCSAYPPSSLTFVLLWWVQWISPEKNERQSFIVHVSYVTFKNSLVCKDF